jgi:hypothetical protein
MAINFLGDAQCKPLDISTLKTWHLASNSTKETLFAREGFKKNPAAFDANGGIMYNYSACWVDFKDGYARYAQTILWYPKHKLMSFVTLDKKNYDQLKESIKKIAKYTDTAPDKTESYKDANFIYTLQVVDFNEPLQKIHPSYVFAIAPLRL